MESDEGIKKISPLHRIIYSFKDMHSYYSIALLNVESAIDFHIKLSQIIKKYTSVKIKDAKILELGCGRPAEQLILFKSDGADSIGIDLRTPTHNMSLKTFSRIVKTEGFKDAVDLLFRYLLFDKRFFIKLFLKYGKKVSLKKIDTRFMDAARLSFPDNSFDFVYSRWVFEHIHNLDLSVKELNRVLKPSGVAWIGIHLFPSISGGHHIKWIFPETFRINKIPPWDHLLKNKHEISPYKNREYLNKLRLKDYREVFNKYINVIDEKSTCKGMKYLTPELKKILKNKGYTTEDLTTEKIVFLCKKR